MRGGESAGAVLFGAVLAHFALAESGGDIAPPGDVFARGGCGALAREWRRIFAEVNHAAFFCAAADVLDAGVSDAEIARLFTAAGDARAGGNWGDDCGADFAGRMQQRLLAGEKSLGAFYTSPASAAFLAGLALHPRLSPGVDWADAAAAGKLRIADPACGAGALLTAALRQILENFARAFCAKFGGDCCGDGNSPLREARGRLLRGVAEGGLFGCDILENAAHLTTASLAVLAPDADFSRGNVFVVDIGGGDGDGNGGAKAGSLEMLEAGGARFPPLDFCLMNPPYVRGTAANPSFGFLPPRARGEVRRRTGALGRRYGFSCDKGLGPGFVALACAAVKAGGRFAAVLPLAAATGAGRAWGGMRARMEKDFDLEAVVASRDPRKPGFSENTALQECIVLARRRAAGEAPKERAFFAVLRRNPKTVAEARAAADALTTARADGKDCGGIFSDVGDGGGGDGNGNGDDGRGGVVVRRREWGRFALLSWRGADAWRGLSFADPSLAAAAELFARTGSFSPGARTGAALCKLADVAAFGGNTLHLRLNHGAFRALEIAEEKTARAGYYPGWHKGATGFAHRDFGGVAERPHCYLRALPGRERWAERFFARAGRVVLNESFRFNTARRLAALVSEPVQASHYWPLRLRKECGENGDGEENEDKLKTLTLWLNSAPALLLTANAAQNTLGAKVGLSQKAAGGLPVPDFAALPRGALQKAAALFDEVARGAGLLPLPLLARDDERLKIDALFSEILPLEDLTPLRNALAAEPIITGKGAGG